MEKYQFTNEQRKMLEGMQMPFAIYQFINKRVSTLVLSDGFCELFGYDDKAEAYHDMDNNMYIFTHPDDVSRIADAAFRFATEGGKYEVIYRSRTKNRPEYKVVHAMGKHIYTEDGVRLAHVWYTDEGTYTDEPDMSVTELNKAINETLRQESLVTSNNYDYLTGLPQMTYFFELAEEGKKAIEGAGGNAVLLFINLRGMKYFNTNYGFAEGNLLIKSVAKILTDIFSNENCCHLNADHYAVYTEEKGLKEKLQRLFEECRGINNGKTLPVCVGIYLNRMEDVLVSTAIDRAKYACDELRDIYGSGYNYFDENMWDVARDRQYIVTNLDRAIDEKWINVYYQPIVRAVNGRVCDEEALARWIDPEKGFLSPADFIPYLEEAGIIYKLDLYVLKQVLYKQNYMRDLGFPLVPQSINLSRSDFDCCDMVEEIREIVDAAGISRSLITIEITESIIGKDFDYMKAQIERFQNLGFPVWMDDFGSGYSSLDVLQEIPFDLIKFDKSFMNRLDMNEKGKIMLTDLMKMATELGLDTVCEGVETEEQVRFLQEVGCSKLQGYYYLKPIPMEQILERYEKGIQIGFENPEESEYYDDMGRINLYDLSFVANKNEDIFTNTFDTLPIGVMEYSPKGNTIKYIRSNASYRDFLIKVFGSDFSDSGIEYPIPDQESGSLFMQKLRQCLTDTDRIIIEEFMPDGSLVHSFARRVAVNPVNGNVTIAVAVLSIEKNSSSFH